MTRQRAFALKLKWRWRRGLAHCFPQMIFAEKIYESLCGQHTIPAGKVGGSDCCRPPSMLRCARCDIEEMKLLRIDESATESKNWRDARPR